MADSQVEAQAPVNPLEPCPKCGELTKAVLVSKKKHSAWSLFFLGAIGLMFFNVEKLQIREHCSRVI